MSEIFFGAYGDVETCCLSWHKLKSYFGYIGTRPVEVPKKKAVKKAPLTGASGAF